MVVEKLLSSIQEKQVGPILCKTNLYKCEKLKKTSWSHQHWRFTSFILLDNTDIGIGCMIRLNTHVLKDATKANWFVLKVFVLFKIVPSF